MSYAIAGRSKFPTEKQKTDETGLVARGSREYMPRTPKSRALVPHLRQVPKDDARNAKSRQIVLGGFGTKIKTIMIIFFITFGYVMFISIISIISRLL